MVQVIGYSPCWIRGSIIEEIIWIGKDVLAWCTGLYIVFFHIVKKQQTLRWCWNNATGDGARCISGHISLPIFAFSERSLNPRIFVLAYPSMTKICECVQGCKSGYLAIAFTSHNHLVSLGSYPDFPIILWCWRTGEKIAIVDTPIRDEVGQIIRINQIGRTIIGQMGKTCGRLLTWELDVIGKTVILKDYEIKLPGEEAMIFGISWCPTSNYPLLAITDKDGHIYLSDYDGTDIQRIVVSQHCGICVDVSVPAVCWFREGIVLRTTFCQIRYFKKEPKTNVWHKQWYIKSIYQPCILVAHPFKNDCLFYYTLEGYLMQMIFSEEAGRKPTIYKYLYNGGKYQFVDFLYPWCHHVAVTDEFKEMSILECYSGNEISKVELNMDGFISAQTTHPNDPLIAVISDQGELIIVGVTNPQQPITLTYFRLQRNFLDLIKFSRSGKFLIAAQKNTGNCYCIDQRRDKPCNVIAQIRPRRRFVDMILHDDEVHRSLKVFALCVKYEMCSASGNEFLVYDVSYSNASQPNRLIQESSSIVMLPALFYEFSQVPGGGLSLIGSPYLKRELYTLKLQHEVATLVDAELTGHHVRLARVSVSRRWIVTCAYDGLVIIRDKTIHQIVAVVPAHHRLDSGSRRAIIDSTGNTVVAIGQDGSLIAVRVRRKSRKESEALPSTIEKSIYPVNQEWYEEQKEKILSDYASFDLVFDTSLTRIKQDFPEMQYGSWEQWREEMQLEKEAKFFAAKKATIMKDLETLKISLQKLLDANETCPEMERLPISAFDLNKTSRDQKLKTARDEREEVRMELEYLCASMNRVANWIKTTFWDPQVVLGRSIFSFRGDMEVSNYPLTQEDPYFNDHLQWAQFVKDSVGTIADDTFQPWRHYTYDQLQDELCKFVRVYHHIDRVCKLIVLLEKEERELDPEELAEMLAIEGMTTHRFVEQSTYFYQQLESYGFAHVILNERFLMDDYNKLRAYFNKHFDDMYAAKEREMSAIQERNKRLRHIESELRIMFDQSKQVPVDPQWNLKEKVENIIEVFREEIKAKPYVTPSQQEILDRQAMEAERMRQLLLIDDFRDRALMKMMDGVLEIRWEETIKIDVRKPACMLEKQPEQYTPDDIKAVKKYEEDVETLQQERERYKRILEADYAKISGLRQEGIEKFDTKLNDLFQLKLKIEAAMKQLKFRHIRGRIQNLTRIAKIQEDEKIKKKITEKHLYKTVLEKHVRKLHDIYQDLFVQHDALCTREKAIVKKLQQEFAALSKVNMQLLERHYKRRPKVSLKNVVASDLLTLAQDLINHTKSAYLPADCADYLKILENLDARPEELPQSIDATHWNHFTQLRRQKINIELKIKAQQLEITFAEQTIAVFENKIVACKSSVDLLTDRLKRMRDEHVLCELDSEVQLVLQRGQVELELEGERRDTVDAILVPRNEIEQVNEHIIAAGARKLDALKRIIDFRHGILSLEWEHRCLRMRFKELEEDLHFLNNITVTRDMRMYLKRKAKGLRDDKTAVRLEKELEIAKKSLNKALSKEMTKLENVRQKITRVKKKNAELDQTVTEMNVARWELEYQRDIDEETKQSKHMDRKMRLFKQRADLIRKLQDNYAELMVLQIEHELLRLRTYPTLKCFETLDDKDKIC
ncbi:cilia- and flagella-associated protein 43-like [Cataglyphis hispanica]|uniref:cilia- and flagella-associated protein 43-like n=1 Tax=Cataglyphis hispanica TaxID=1086592 RepID=UPI00217FD5CB|nr:cilia- and flagella-associated protein 43-like [Cataglyphis hispanica]